MPPDGTTGWRRMAAIADRLRGTHRSDCSNLDNTTWWLGWPTDRMYVATRSHVRSWNVSLDPPPPRTIDRSSRPTSSTETVRARLPTTVSNRAKRFFFFFLAFFAASFFFFFFSRNYVAFFPRSSCQTVSIFESLGTFSMEQGSRCFFSLYGDAGTTHGLSKAATHVCEFRCVYSPLNAWIGDRRFHPPDGSRRDRYGE